MSTKQFIQQILQRTRRRETNSDSRPEANDGNGSQHGSSNKMLVLVKKCAADTGNSSCNVLEGEKCCKSIGCFVSQLELRWLLQKKQKKQMTPTARKATPPADPANGKEATAMAANMAPATNACPCQRNVLQILATAAATYRREKMLQINRPFRIAVGITMAPAETTKETNDTDGGKGNTSVGSCKRKGSDGDGSQHGSSNKRSSLSRNVLLILATAAATYRRQKKCCKLIGRFVSQLESRWLLQKKHKNQTTLTARKATPPVDPANGKEAMAMAANTAPATNACPCQRNVLLILATAAAMFWRPKQCCKSIGRFISLLES